MMNKPYKIVVFDLDETLGYFTEFGIFCDCLNYYFKNNKYSDIHFNELLDLFPEFIRPKIFSILKYLKLKKEENKCYKVMIYTNNQGHNNWALNIKKYFDTKIDYKLFDQIIAAFKVRGKPVELGRTSHDKTIDDFINCTKLPTDIEICFIDDVYHDGMNNDRVYYINIKPYYNKLSIKNMISQFLDSTLVKDVHNTSDFIESIEKEFKKYNYRITEKTKEEQDIDEIISKRMLQHLKQFFYENNNKTLNRNKREKKNKTVRRKK